MKRRAPFLRADRLALHVALAMLRGLSLFVPRGKRGEWVEEWRGELLARYPTPAATAVEAPGGAPPAPRRGRSFGLLRDAAGALFDALWHAREDWRLEIMSHDVRFAMRTLFARPVFTATVVLTLALGIGSNAVIFSAVDAVVLNPFDFPQPDRIVGVGTIFPQLNIDLGFFERISAPEFADIREEVDAFEAVAAFDLGNRQIIGGDAPQNLFTAFWWHDVLPVLGFEPALGRGFSRQDIVDQERVALISHRVWQSRFAGDASVVGMSIRIDDEPFTLIGVMPPEVLIYRSDLWMPMWADPALLPRDRRQFNVIARLAPDADLERANAQLEALARRTEQEYLAEFEEYRDWRLAATSWTDVNVQTLKPAALILLAAVGFVLLLVCTNVASLLLSRAAGRQREIALRAALGAGRARIVRQLMTESGLLAAAGGLLGCGLAFLGVRTLVARMPDTLIPTTTDISVDTRVLMYTAVVSVLAGIVFGLAPALQTSRFDLQRTLNLDAGRTTGSRGRRRLHSVFVAVEVALALVLLAGAGLFLASFTRLNAVDPGLETDNVLTMRLTLPWNKYEGAAITGFFDDLVARVETIPGVVAVGAAAQFPPAVFSLAQFVPEGAETTAEGSLPAAYLTLADEAYFGTLRIPIVRGRQFTADDRPDGRLVTVINETLAATYFPGVDPLGKRIRIGAPTDEGPTAEIVGIAADTKNQGLGAATQPEFFVSLRQADGRNNQIFLIVRAAVEPGSIIDAVRAEVGAIDPDQPIYAIQTLQQSFAAQFAPQRFAFIMLGAFAMMALALAAVGIYGVVSSSVADRTREIGVRIALGAGRGEVLRLVVRQALLPVGVGVIVGLALTVALTGAIGSMLYDVDGSDPVTLGAVAMILTSVAVLAGYLPARRASGVDPVDALRAD